MTVRVVVHYLYTGQVAVFEGEHGDVCDALRERYEWLTTGSWRYDFDLEGLVARLNELQALEAALDIPEPGQTRSRA